MFFFPAKKAQDVRRAMVVEFGEEEPFYSRQIAGNERWEV
jgi:hypothetical protein